MSAKITKIIDLLLTGGVFLVVFLFPLFFLPLTYDYFEFNKNIFLVFTSIVFLLLFLVKMVINKSVAITKTLYILPLALVAFSFLISNILISPNKLETFFATGSTGTIIFLTIFYFIVTNIINDKQTAKKLLYFYLISSVLVSLISISGLLELTTKIPFPLPEWITAKAFTPTGGIVSLASLLIPAIIIAGSLLFGTVKARIKKLSFFYSFTLLLLVVGFALSFRHLFLNRPVILPFQDGWFIAIETLKQSPLFGFGPNDFLSAFTKYHSLNFNLTTLWATRFGISSNWYFQILTTLGVIGLGVYFLLIWKFIKNGFIDLKNKDMAFIGTNIAITVIFLLLILFPINLVLMFTLYLFLAISALQGSTSVSEEKSSVLPWFLFVPVVILTIGGFYFFGKNWLGDYYFRKAVTAYAQNNGGDTYNWQIKALNQAPYQSAYHYAYSQTNLALATSLAGKKDLTDQDRQNISTLIQQAIREAKTEIALNPQNVTAWENLAMIYQNLVNYAKDAESWTIAAYQQAINLEPYNPNLRLALGGVYYSLKNWSEAQKQFEFAAQLKPNLANARYNLSSSLREQGKFDQAAAEMEVVLTIVPKDSQDYQKAQSELDALRKKLAEIAKKESGKPSETLKTPTPAPTGIKPPIVLPTGAAPVISVTPSPTLTPTPTLLPTLAP